MDSLRTFLRRSHVEASSSFWFRGEAGLVESVVVCETEALLVVLGAQGVYELRLDRLGDKMHCATAPAGCERVKKKSEQSSSVREKEMGGPSLTSSNSATESTGSFRNLDELVGFGAGTLVLLSPAALAVVHQSTELLDVGRRGSEFLLEEIDTLRLGELEQGSNVFQVSTKRERERELDRVLTTCFARLYSLSFFASISKPP
jgi:hypothetical protein